MKPEDKAPLPTGKLDAADRAPAPAETFSTDPQTFERQVHDLLDRMGIAKGKQ